MWIGIGLIVLTLMAVTGKIYVGTDIYKYRQAWFGVLLRK